MHRNKPRVLLVASEEHSVTAPLLSGRDVEVERVLTLESATPRLESMLFDVVVIEASGDHPETWSGLADFCERWRDVPVLACGADAADVADRALAAGAVEFVPVPVSPPALTAALDSALARSRDAALAPEPMLPGSTLLGNSRLLAGVRDTIVRAAPGRATVLIRGETGTGKELVARAIHEHSARRAAPFVRIHAAALPDSLLESELFGYERGAFTGATGRKPGRVELAEGGTLFFDEIGEVSPAIQVKLLRLVQEREYERLGGGRTIHADVRIIAATHRDLEDMIAAGTFREDLFYRLNVVRIWLPPLRARREDVDLIVRHYLKHFGAENGSPAMEMEEAALRILQTQRWPGNVRQLVNFVERLVVLSRGQVITAADVQRDLDEHLAFLTQAASRESAAGGAPPSSSTPGDPGRSPPEQVGRDHLSSVVRPLREDVRRAEHRALTKALRSAGGNRALAARMLGISRRTLYTKLEEHGIE